MIKSPFCQGNGAPAAVQTRADGNYFRDAGGGSTTEEFRKIFLVLRIIQMSMGIEKDGHDYLLVGG